MMSLFKAHLKHHIEAFLKKHPIDVWVPVPYHAFRLYQRGFNVLDIIYNDIFNEFGIKKCNVLKRQFFTKRLYKLSRYQRKQAVNTSFVALPYDRSIFSTKRVLLVDDIVTTQSTMKACLGILKQEFDCKTLSCMSLVKVNL